MSSGSDDSVVVEHKQLREMSVEEVSSWINEHFGRETALNISGEFF